MPQSHSDLQNVRQRTVDNTEIIQIFYRKKHLFQIIQKLKFRCLVRSPGIGHVLEPFRNINTRLYAFSMFFCQLRNIRIGTLFPPKFRFKEIGQISLGIEIKKENPMPFLCQF